MIDATYRWDVMWFVPEPRDAWRWAWSAARRDKNEAFRGAALIGVSPAYREMAKAVLRAR